MAKYSFELKLTIVYDYLEGIDGYSFLAQKYGIKNETQARNWVNNCRCFGE